MSDTLRIGGTEIAPGTEQTLSLPVAPLYTHAEMAIPVRVIRGKKDGPRLFVSAAIHGDEINGVEIIRRLLRLKQLRRLRGTLIAVPVVNVYGYTSRTRYLPDRRDLNRSFPGSPKGSMASRLAHLFLEEIVAHCTHGIDLHTGAVHRANLPHVRACLDDEHAAALARAFRVPVIMHANLRDGSLRQAVLDHEVPVLLYEAGEALRFDERAIQVGLRGVLSVMRSLGMLPGKSHPAGAVAPMIAHDSKWVRAPESGTLMVRQTLGARVEKGDLLGVLTSPLGDEEIPVEASTAGMIIGQTMLPLVYEGEGLFNIAELDAAAPVVETLETFDANLDAYVRDFEAASD